MLCYLPCRVSPKEAFWGHSPPSGKDMEFLSCPFPLRSWGDRWQWCFNHQELVFSLRKPLHGTSQELSWLQHLPEEMLGNSLTPLAALGVSIPLPPFPLPCPAPAHIQMVFWRNSDYQGDGLLAWFPLFYPTVTPKKNIHMARICVRVGPTETQGFIIIVGACFTCCL